MAGVKGRSGGQNRKALDELLMGHTFQRSRHAHLLTLQTPAPNTAAIRERIREQRLLKEQLEYWRAVLKESPRDMKVARFVAQLQQRYLDSLGEDIRRGRTARRKPQIDAFEAFQRRRNAGHGDDDAA
jgi:hypothetical protein